jgi:Putative Actinobacterial Holin-X, holin superfamily III
MTAPDLGGATAMTPPPAPASTTSTTDDSPSIGQLFGEISKDLSTLMRQEVALAKAEVTQSAKQASKGVGMFGGAAYAGHLTVLFLSLALWAALSYWLDNFAWAALIVAILWGIIAAVLALRGKKEIKEVQGLPKTADTVKKIPDALHGNEEAAR